MRLLVKPNLCLAMDFREHERQVFLDSLWFPNPSPTREEKDNPYYDGKVSFFVDAYKTQFPTGLLSHVISHLAANSVLPEVTVLRPFQVSDKQVDPDLFSHCGIKLHDYQVGLANAAIRSGRGIVSAPPRSGKTLIQAAVAATLGLPSVMFVQRESLLDQQVECLRKYGLNPGIIRGNVLDYGATHAVAMLQTVNSRIRSPDMVRWLESREVMQFDEVHHTASAQTYQTVAFACPASWRLGYSGTPYNVHDLSEGKFNPEHWCLAGAFGPLIGEVSLGYLQSIGRLVPVDVMQVRHDTPFSVAELDGHNWHPVYSAGIVENESRNQSIVRIVARLVEAGRVPLVLIKQVAHGETLQRMLLAAGVPAAFSRGGKTLIMPDMSRRSGNVGAAYAALKKGQCLALIATQVADEGVDLPIVDALVMAVGGKADKVNTQRAFRPLTATEGKSSAVVIDFDDRQHGVLKTQSAARRKLYRTLGFNPRIMSIDEVLENIKSV